MDSINLNFISTLDFKDPKPFLINLRKLEYKISASEMPGKLKSLRTNSLNEWRELREAALFCYLMAERIGTTVFLAKDESQDYDFIASWMVDHTRLYAPVQIKEFVPEKLNPLASIDSIISKLKTKYLVSPELIVAIHLNRQCRIDLNSINISNLDIGGLWMFGAISSNQNQWGLWGDFLNNPTLTLHEYPALND